MILALGLIIASMKKTIFFVCIPYGVVHRIAARAGSGAGKFAIDWAFHQCGHLRIDTHGDNLVMQKVLEGLGFTRCGIIYIEEDNDPRIAFEKVTAAV